MDGILGAFGMDKLSLWFFKMLLLDLSPRHLPSRSKAIVGGIFFLIIFSMVSTVEEQTGRHARRVLIMNTVSARR